MSSKAWGGSWSFSPSTSRMAARPSQWDQSLEWLLDTPQGRVSFLLLHFVIGAVGSNFKPILSLHYVLITLFGVRQIFLRRPQALWILVVFGSFAVCEVLWRMYAPYFSAKQADYTLIILGLALLVRRRFVSSPVLPWIILLLLLVSSLHITHSFVGFLAPVLLRVFILPYLTLVVTWSVMVSWRPCVHFWPRLLVICAAGVLSVAAFAAFSAGVFSAHELNASRSSFVGTHAPNQVSAVLGFGGLCALLVPLILDLAWAETCIWFVSAGFLFERMILSMSRGGLYSVVGALIPIFFYVVISGNKRQRWMCAGWLWLGVLILALATIQGGAGVQARWSNTKTTGRIENFVRELQIAKNTWLSGAGLGGSSVTGGHMASHTEISRLLAEHGLFGASVLALLVVALSARLRRSSGRLDMALRLSLFLWCLVTQMHNSIRLPLVMMVFAFGLAKTLNHPEWPLRTKS